MTDPIDEILEASGLKGPWEPLPATGLANRIYATKDVVIRVAKEHDEALRDARTESIAAPIAYAAGILTPRLLVFDESGELFDRPYSIWERVHGETLGMLMLEPHSMPNTWRQVGHQMGLLHTTVKPFDDSKKYLHEPERERNLVFFLEKLESAGCLSNDVINEISILIAQLQPAVLGESTICFLHSDVKEMNIMCTKGDELLALIDWGDSGWGDPTFDFRQIPLSAIPFVLEGYGEVAPNILGKTLRERIIWDKLSDAMEQALETPSFRIPIGEFRQFLKMDQII